MGSMHYEESRMCQSNNGVNLSDSGQRPVQTRTLPQEVREVLDAAESLYRAVEEHVPAVSLSSEVVQEWKRLGECLAWLRH